MAVIDLPPWIDVSNFQTLRHLSVGSDQSPKDTADLPTDSLAADGTDDFPGLYDIADALTG